MWAHAHGSLCLFPTAAVEDQTGTAAVVALLFFCAGVPAAVCAQPRLTLAAEHDTTTRMPCSSSYVQLAMRPSKNQTIADIPDTNAVNTDVTHSPITGRA